jgi:hypothetical protein
LYPSAGRPSQLKSWKFGKIFLFCKNRSLLACRASSITRKHGLLKTGFLTRGRSYAHCLIRETRLAQWVIVYPGELFWKLQK